MPQEISFPEQDDVKKFLAKNKQSESKPFQRDVLHVFQYFELVRRDINQWYVEWNTKKGWYEKEEKILSEDEKRNMTTRIVQLAKGIECGYETLSRIFLRMVLLDLPESIFPSISLLPRTEIRAFLETMECGEDFPRPPLPIVMGTDIPGTPHAVVEGRRAVRDVQEKVIRMSETGVAFLERDNEAMNGMRLTRLKVLMGLLYHPDEVEFQIRMLDRHLFDKRRFLKVIEEFRCEQEKTKLARWKRIIKEREMARNGTGKKNDQKIVRQSLKGKRGRKKKKAAKPENHLQKNQAEGKLDDQNEQK